MKKKTVFTLTLIALSALLIGACAPLETVSAEAAPVEAAVPVVQATQMPNSDSVHQAQNGQGNNPNQEDCEGTPEFVAAGELSQAEVDALAFMREEEKLARDVYLTLYDEWGLPVFQNIASSEQKHTDAVKSLLDFYGATDPVTDDTVGVFVNPDLQALYDQLVEQGSTSLTDALTVGTAIEEIDILDLQEYLAETDDPNIIMVYNNLLNGSYNHLNAFVSQYEGQSGETFSPSYMTLEGFNEALSNAHSGGGHSGGGGHGNSGGGHWGNSN